MIRKLIRWFLRLPDSDPIQPTSSSSAEGETLDDQRSTADDVDDNEPHESHEAPGASGAQVEDNSLSFTDFAKGLHSTIQEVRRAAFANIDLFEPDKVIDELLHVLRNSARDEISCDAINALKDFGSRARPAMPDLAVLSVSRNKSIAEKAVEALNAIDAEWFLSSNIAACHQRIINELPRLDFSRSVGLLGKHPRTAISAVRRRLKEAHDDVETTLLLRVAGEILAQTQADSISDWQGLAEQIEDFIQNGPVHVRREAAIALARFGDCTTDGQEALLRALVSERDLGVKQALVRAIGNLIPPDIASQFLVWRLADKDDDVADEAAAALIDFGYPAVPWLVAMLEKTSEFHKNQQTSIGNLLEQEGISVHDVFTEAIWKISEKRIANVLGSIGEFATDAIPILLTKATSKDPEMRANVASALGKIQPDHDFVVEQLIRFLTDRNENVRKSAMAALKRSNVEWTERYDFQSALTDLVNRLDETSAVELVSKTVSDIGSPAVPVLTDVAGNRGLFDSRSRSIREHSAHILGVIGSQLPEGALRSQIRHHLEDSANNSNEHGFVRKAAQDSLKQIE